LRKAQSLNAERRTLKKNLHLSKFFTVSFLDFLTPCFWLKNEDCLKVVKMRTILVKTCQNLSKSVQNQSKAGRLKNE
jgi:hypothetical protein